MEKIGYYELLADIGVPYFHFGGTGSTNRLMQHCRVDHKKDVLVVGCGTAYSACYIAKHYGCKVVGIDIVQPIVAKASQRAQQWGQQTTIQFCVADAYTLPFADDTFDVVLTEFVSVFLEKRRIFNEYVRVLKDGGFVGINELYKSDKIPPEAGDLIEQATAGFKRAVGLPLILPTRSQWKSWFAQAGLRNIQSERVQGTYRLAEYTSALGGPFKLQELIIKTIYHWTVNKRFRDQLMKVRGVADMLMRNEKTTPYVGALLCVGQKCLP